ncbi:MAG: alpha/beta hydrolase [Gammaproteobacteria bacterium]|nr:alpha/beta hydrolase [Gammaproteobacteria bacterium]
MSSFSHRLLAGWLLSITLLSPELVLAASFDSDGVQIYYEERGAGEPVVLLHGFSQTLQMWNETGLAEALARRYRVISVDLRGHGNSGKPHKPEEYGPEMGADVIRLLDHLQLSKANLIGFSMGATIVSKLLTTHPSRVSTAVLGSGFFPRWSEEEEEFAQFTKSRAISGERHPWEPENQDYVALAAAIRGLRYADVLDEEIVAIATPTVVVIGSIELQHFSSENCRRLSTLPESISTIIIAGADHDREKPAILQPEFLNAVIELIDDHK